MGAANALQVCIHADVVKGLNLCLRLSLHPYLLYGSSDCSDKCAPMMIVYVVKGLHPCLILYLQPYLLYEISEVSGESAYFRRLA